MTLSADFLEFGIPIAEKLLRTVAVYLFLLVGLRLAGKRELGKLNPFDLVVLLLLSNTVQNAIIGDDTSLLGGIIGAMALLLINYVVVRFLYGHKRLERWVEGEAEILVRNGQVLQKSLKRNLITKDELEAAAREQDISDLREVQCARLEVSGAITFETASPTREEARHRELLQRLAALESQVSAIAVKTQ